MRISIEKRPDYLQFEVPPDEDDEQKAAKALRSLLPQERKLLEDVFAQVQRP